MANHKFVAPTMNLALQKVKQELGKDAVILSHSTINGEVHLVAALQPETSLEILLTKGVKQGNLPVLEMPCHE
ncbi:MAG TPA: hypothetical protein PLD88_00045, partial [Candidatus Berkiella sp.]|nr:hypothetical protein [Candidatus Berkiella sp.]